MTGIAMCVYMYVCMWLCLYVCIFGSGCACMFVCMHLFECGCVFVCCNVCVYVRHTVRQTGVSTLSLFSLFGYFAFNLKIERETGMIKPRQILYYTLNIHCSMHIVLHTFY